jgi:2-polyprenyl-3-methyl-5-hydroxy-6-metoxy-1,4-benzoquinol methylase
MASIKDDRGYNQGYKPSKALNIRTQRRCDYIISQMDNANINAETLEIGCGTGELSFILATKTQKKVLGTDLCVPFIEKANRTYILPNLSFMVVDFNYPEPLTGRKFDYIVGNGILHHLYADMDKALWNIKKLLKPNGRIVFLEPNLYNPYCFLIFHTTSFFRKWAQLEPGEMALSKRKMKNALQSAGYQSIKIEYKDFLLPNTPAFLIDSLIVLGSLLENIPFINKISQSIYITARGMKV